MTRWDAASQSGPDDFVIRAIRFGFEHVTSATGIWECDNNGATLAEQSQLLEGVAGFQRVRVALVELEVELLASLLQVRNPKNYNFPNRKNPIIDIYEILRWNGCSLKNLSFALKLLCSTSRCSHSIKPHSLLQRTSADKKWPRLFMEPSRQNPALQQNDRPSCIISLCSISTTTRASP